MPTFDEPFEDENGDIIIIVRDDNGNIIGFNTGSRVPDSDA